RIPDVDHLSDRFGLVDQLQQRADDVGDVRERARLRAVAEHRDRFARQRLPYEIGNYHSVLAGLPRPDGIEETHDDHRELALLPVGESEELVDGLAARIVPAMLWRRAHN